MLASLRAELLVLRKWRAAWALVAAVPLYVIILWDLGSYVQYLTASPLQASLSPGLLSSDLATVSPSQFVQVAAVGLNAIGPIVAMLLGALVAAGDWERGTIKTSLSAGPGRARTVAGQAVALGAALTVGVLATFALALGASLAIWSLGHGAFAPGAGTLPPLGTVGHAIGVTVLVSAAYGTAGLVLGSLVRGVGGAAVACFVWVEGVETTVANLGASQNGGVFTVLYDHLPLASATTLTDMFGLPGGGGALLPVSPTSAIWALLSYTGGFLALTVVVVWLRDVDGRGTGRLRRLLRRREAPKARALWDRPVQPELSSASGDGRRWLAGVGASLRAELFVLARWPAIVALVVGPSLYALLHNYLIPYVLYRTAAPATAAGQLPALLPGQFAAGFLNSFFPTNLFYFAPFLLIGAWVAGSSWTGGTLKTALLQWPSRAQTLLGQGLAVGAAVAVSPILTFVLTGATSEVIALSHAGAVPPGDGSFASPAQLAGAIGAAVVIALAYAAIGFSLGSIFRSPGAAMAVVLLWAVAVQPTLLAFLAPGFHGVTLAVYDFLPGAATATLAFLFGTGGYGYFGAPATGSPGLATPLSFTVLVLYAVVFLTLPAWLIRRRNIV